MRKRLFLLLFATLTAWAANPIYATWKINLEKSKLQNPAAWKDRVMIIEPAGGNTYKTTFITPNGKTQRTEEIRYLDGKEHPRSTNPAETMITQIIDDHHHRLIFKRDGKEIGSIDGIISADGKVMTNNYKGLDNNGKEIQERRVFDRQ